MAGAAAHAAAAAHAEDLAVALLEVGELVEVAVAQALLLGGPGVVAARHAGIVGEHAGVPAAELGALSAVVLVVDVEAVAGGAQVGAGAAAQAGVAVLVPDGVLKVGGELLG